MGCSFPAKDCLTNVTIMLNRSVGADILAGMRGVNGGDELVHAS